MRVIWNKSRDVASQVSRGFIGEWAVTIILLLFGTTTLLQAFVIPTGSMENTLLVGDHVLVNKLTYSPTDQVTRHWLPYREVQRGDVIVFSYPLDITRDLVKRAIGVPGDRIRLENKRLILNGKLIDEPYAVIFLVAWSRTATTFRPLLPASRCVPEPPTCWSATS